MSTFLHTTLGTGTETMVRMVAMYQCYNPLCAVECISHREARVLDFSHWKVVFHKIIGAKVISNMKFWGCFFGCLEILPVLLFLVLFLALCSGVTPGGS